MLIRKAKKEDSIIIAEHLFLAMEDILYQFIGVEDAKKAKEFLLHFVERENNQYSYQNCLVAESADGVEGSINIYNGGELDMLRRPVVRYIREHFNSGFTPEDETQQGEYYIDTFGVSPNSQGKGVGTKLLQYVIHTYGSNQQTLGLLVDEDNPNAEKLYVNLGFKIVGRKVIAEKKMKHLQRKPSSDKL
ncbi:GNAT family N-acetyltransferase [Muricauda sp. CAU 1633]|uniref:GNAT family N-acetyltransferase n=1 Tax=Allomuricauda sp. CAU 1633 TaxID=2816036 RepID=UPI001A8F6F28|nr:N-acetyltransferase [Muricauda sp. CAU 1633]MBO0321972.1 GNAT family N-acetyltransferase [Muricauda sp. CAU 1633]